MAWKVIISLSAICFFPFGISADHCNIRHVQVVQQVQAVVATPVVVASFVPVAVAVPVYGVGYTGTDANEIQALRAEIKELRAALTLRNVERKEALSVPKGLSVLQNRCASCHDDVNAKVKGNGIQFFNGPTFMDAGDIPSKILDQINNDQMPKGKEKLSAQEKYDLLWYLTVKEVKK